MSELLQRANLPDLRDFLDSLPSKPCSSKLPEEYCKMCRRLNREVADYCKTKKPPQRTQNDIPLEEPSVTDIPLEEPSVTDIPFKEPPIRDIPLQSEETQYKEEEEKEEKSKEFHKRNPILDRPTYEDGATSLEFISSQRSIEEARKSLPRFIQVRKGPRSFRPIEEEASFELDSLSGSSIFRSPNSLAEDEDDMMFTLVSHENEIEVVPIEIEAEGQFSSETVFASSDGVVEIVEVPSESESISFEEDIPTFEFMASDEGEIIEAEIVEAEILEEAPTFETFTTQDQIGEAKQEIQSLADEITDMTESLDQELEDVPPAQIVDSGEIGHLGEAESEPSKKSKKTMKKKRTKRKRKVKKVEMGEAPEPVSEPKVGEPQPKPIIQESEVAPQEVPVPEIPFEEDIGFTPEVEEKAPHVPPKKSKMKLKLKRKKKVKNGKKKEISEPVSEPITEEPQPEPISQEPVFTPQEVPTSEIPLEVPEIEEETPPEAIEKPKMKLKFKKKRTVKKGKMGEIPEPVPEPMIEEHQPEPISQEPELTHQEEPIPEIPFDDDIGFTHEVEEEPTPEIPVDDPFLESEDDLGFTPDAEEESALELPIEEEPFPEAEDDIGFTPDAGEEPTPELPIEEEPFLGFEDDIGFSPDTGEESVLELPIEEEPFPETIDDIGFTTDTEEEPLEEVSLDKAVEDSPITEAEEPTDEGEANLYMCPSCGAFVSMSASLCGQCGYDFEAEENLSPVEEQNQMEIDEPAFEPFLETEITDENADELEISQEKSKKKKRKVKLKKKKKLKMKRVKKKKTDD